VYGSAIDARLVLRDGHGGAPLAECAGARCANGYVHVPGGMLEDSETVRAAGIREAREEVEVELGDDEFVTVVHHRNPRAETKVGPFFITRTSTGHPVKAEADERSRMLRIHSAGPLGITRPWTSACLARIASGCTSYTADGWPSPVGLHPLTRA
jgi:8-oxo-dGTP pyrophosphatase MutT (NUDIX family)